jgi:hypothetical protein
MEEKLQYRWSGVFKEITGRRFPIPMDPSGIYDGSAGMIRS